MNECGYVKAANIQFILFVVMFIQGSSLYEVCMMFVLCLENSWEVTFPQDVDKVESRNYFYINKICLMIKHT